MLLQLQAASASLVDALLKAHAGDSSQLMAQLQSAQGAAAAAGGSQVSSAFGFVTARLLL